MSRGKILLLDDDPHILNYLKEHLALNDYEVEAFGNPAKGIEKLNKESFDLILSDVKMGEMTGDEVLNFTLKNHPGTGVILMTGFGNINHSVNAMRKGAYDYITKPFSGKEIISRINYYFKNRSEDDSNVTPGSVSKSSDRNIIRISEEEDSESNPVEESQTTFIGQHEQIQKLLDALPQIAKNNAPIMIEGESGTGKEVFAKLIQRNSLRADKPFVKINCANLPSELVESTLFGHVKGAFTGATTDKKGAFLEADGGTLLLDEITEIEPHIQAKLLRAIQENEFNRVGSQKLHKVDVRIISTTNRKMAKAIKEGTFRQDLYYRLNVFPVVIPPLRKRRSDIPLLAQHFAQKYATRYHLPEKKISSNLMKMLELMDWKGNVRELENYVQRGVIMSQSEEKIRIEHIQNELFENIEEKLDEQSLDEMPIIPIDEMELQMIKKALEYTNGNQKEAAEMLHISDRTIRNKLKKIKDLE